MGKIIGIVGGVGPYAGLDLNKKVFDNMKTNGTDQDFLDVFLLSRSSDIPDRTMYLENKIDTNPALGLFRSICKLEQIGASVIAIPCNTAHSPKIYNKVLELMDEKKCGAKLLHIVKETHIFLEKNFQKNDKIGLLGTLGTYKTKLYEDYFKQKGRFELINPSEDGKENSHKAIYSLDFGVKAFSSPVTKKAKTMFENEIDKLKSKGAKAVILGCTEIPLAFLEEQEYNDITLIDPTNILARALIREADIEHLKDADI